MSVDPPTARPFSSRLMEAVCQRLPNCTRALQLVETGCRRELSTREKLALKYHGRLCPFCGCASGKFDSALARMRGRETPSSNTKIHGG
jgi:hypothetical protein